MYKINLQNMVNSYTNFTPILNNNNFMTFCINAMLLISTFCYVIIISTFKKLRSKASDTFNSSEYIKDLHGEKGAR